MTEHPPRLSEMIDPDFASRRARYTRVSRMVYGLLLLDEWEGSVPAFTARLTEPERTQLAACLLWAMHPENVRVLAEMVIGSTGTPARPLFQGQMKAARAWARRASVTERKAWAIASVEAMDDPERNSFREWLKGLGDA